MASKKRLNKAQREALIEWVAEGLASDEINQRAAKWKPRFSVTRQQVDHYRKTRKVDIDKLKESGEFNALKRGLALVNERVQLLQDLADKLKFDLFDAAGKGLWLANKKAVGMTTVFDYEEFNSAEVAQLRGVLDDIAQEVGERGKTLEHKGNVGLFDMDAWKKVREARLKGVKELEE